MLVRMDEGISTKKKIIDDSGWMPELECGTLFLCSLCYKKHVTP